MGKYTKRVVGLLSALNTSYDGTVSGSSATNLGKAEDDASAAGDVGVKVLGIRQDTLATVVSAAGTRRCVVNFLIEEY